MTIRELIGQFKIQGAYCIETWKDNWGCYVILAEGEDFEVGCREFNENCLNSNITCMYVANSVFWGGVLNIEVELN